MSLSPVASRAGQCTPSKFMNPYKLMAMMGAMERDVWIWVLRTSGDVLN